MTEFSREKEICSFGIGILNLFGIWCLEFGILGVTRI